MRWVNPIIAGLLCTLELTACAQFSSSDGSQDYYVPPQPESAQQEQGFTPATDCGGTLSSEQRMYLELVYKMLRQGQYYAVLAHIDELEKQAESPQTFYLRAEALRHLGQQDAAEKYYQLLLGGCMTGYGLHGLGLLATASNRLPDAETFLKHACRERPVDARVHNDYGMVLLLRGRYPAAHDEFMTSLQLDQANRLPLENLIVLMLVEKQDNDARQFAKRHGLTAEDIARLKLRALQLNNASPSNDSAEGEASSDTVQSALAVDQPQTSEKPRAEDQAGAIDDMQSSGQSQGADVAPLTGGTPSNTPSQTIDDTQAVDTPVLGDASRLIDDTEVDSHALPGDESYDIENLPVFDTFQANDPSAIIDNTQLNDAPSIDDDTQLDSGPLSDAPSPGVEDSQANDKPSANDASEVIDDAQIDGNPKAPNDTKVKQPQRD